MPSELQQNRYDQIVRRVGGIIGPGSKVAEALSELFPVVDVERVPGELLLLGQTSLCWGSFALTATGGNRPRIQLFNPAGSGKLGTCSKVVVSSSSAQIVRFATNNTALTTGVGTEVFRDRRLLGTSRPTLQIRTDATVALTDAHGQIEVRANTAEFLQDENSLAVLPPNSGFELGGITAATQLIVTFFWRERVAIESELNF